MNVKNAFNNKMKIRKLKGGNKNMRKILAVGAILAIFTLLISTFALGMSAFGFGKPTITGRAVDIFGVEEKVDEAEAFASDAAINPVDVYEVEQEIEIETEIIASGDTSYKSRKMVEVQGFTNDGTRAALIKGIWLKSTVYLTDDSAIESFTKGKLKISGMTFDAERIGSDSEDEAVFSLRGPAGQTGTLSIVLDDTFNEGKIKTWTGSLSVDLGDFSYEGDVELQTEEKLLRPEPVRLVKVESGVSTIYAYEGVIELNDESYKLSSVGNSGEDRFDAYLYGEDEQEGKFSIRAVERNDDDTIRTYNGRIYIQESDGNKELEGRVVVTVERDSEDSDEWVGRIVVTGEQADFEIIGEISFSQETTKVSRTLEGKTVDQYGRDLPGDRIAERAKADSNVNERGFFARIREFFGVDA